MGNSRRILGKIVLLVFLLGIFLPLFPFSQASGLSISYAPFWFSVSEPTTISHPDMHFRVYNLGEEPIKIDVSFKAPENVNVSIQFEWNTVILNATSSLINAYSLTVNSSFSVTARLEIRVLQLPIDSSDPQIVASGTVINYITFFSEANGAIMKINVLDQSQTPIEASVDVFFRVNNSFAWTPFLEFVGLSYEGLFPVGDYYIRAIDHKSGRVGETKLTLSNNTETNVIITFILFRTFSILVEGEQDEVTDEILFINQMGMVAYIDNYIEIVSSLEIYAELYLDDKLIDTTNRDYHQSFDPVTMYKVELWFKKGDYKTGTYSVRAFINIGGVRAAEDIRYLPYYRSPKPKIDIKLEHLALAGCSIVILGLIIKNRRLSNGKKQD